MQLSQKDRRLDEQRRISIAGGGKMRKRKMAKGMRGRYYVLRYDVKICRMMQRIVRPLRHPEATTNFRSMGCESSSQYSVELLTVVMFDKRRRPLPTCYI